MRFVLLISVVLAMLGCQDHAPREAAVLGPVPPRVITVAKPDHPAYLLVLLHGVGASADDLVPLGRALAPFIPSTEIISPDGIAAFEGGASGRQWFSIRGVTEDNRTPRVQEAAAVVSAWLDRELAARSLGADKLLLLGFSQGAIISNTLALARRPSPAGVVSFSGRLAASTELKTSGHPRVLVMHGSADAVIPVGFGREAAAGLTERGAMVTFEELSGLGHGIDERELTRATRFFVEVTGGSPPVPAP